MTKNKLITIIISIILLTISGFIAHLNLADNLELPKNEKVVLIRPAMNGIGNQLFQFAAGYSLAKRLDAKLWIIAKHTTTDRKDHTKFALDHFNISYDKLLFMNSKQLDKALRTQAAIKVDESNFFSISASDGDVFYTDNKYSYFGSDKFFLGADADIFNINFKTPLPSTAIVEAIDNSESVAVHFRFGDFVTEKRTIPILFQLQAMQKMKSKVRTPHFFIFSDDIELATNVFAGVKDVTIASAPQNSAIEELQMMTRCKHIITANSTFSWWAAYLIQNPKKIVISPTINGNTDSYPSSWIVMNPNTIHAMP